MIRKPELSLDFAAATDIGCERGNNEDSFGYDGDMNLYVVCDGMGGSAAGEIASALAVRALIESFEHQFIAIPDSHPDADASGAATYSVPIEECLANSIREANRQVCAAAAADSALHDMGTTLVCALLDGARFVVGNVGDSRAYLIRESVCAQVTLDHSLVDEQLRSGLITQQMADQSTEKSVITRAVGVSNNVEPDLFSVDLISGDMLLLASDGLTRYAEPEDIASAASPGDDLSIICQRLIDYAKDRGGKDNITCVILRLIAKPQAADAVEETEAARAASEAETADLSDAVTVETDTHAAPTA